jgi:argininosuccinate synthase
VGEVPDYVFSRTDDLMTAPDTPEEITIDFKGGDGVAVNGERCRRLGLLTRLNELGKRHGIGRLDLLKIASSA